MKREIIPTREELERHKEIIPEINPSAVIAMLGIKAVGDSEFYYGCFAETVSFVRR